MARGGETPPGCEVDIFISWVLPGYKLRLGVVTGTGALGTRLTSVTPSPMHICTKLSLEDGGRGIWGLKHDDGERRGRHRKGTRCLLPAASRAGVGGDPGQGSGPI